MSQPTHDTDAVRLSRRRGRRSITLLTMAALLYGAALFLQPNGFISPEGRRGADGYSQMLFRAYLHHSVHTDRRLPLWCPFVGGGYPIFAHPADDSLTPFAVPVLLFGEILGVKINMVPRACARL